MKKYGYEMIVETARFWMEYGNFAQINGRRQFVINRVTGPDEYSAVVDNNYYTNKLAKLNLDLAVRYYSRFEKLELISRLNLSQKEIDEMKQADELMYLPYDEEKKVKLQFQNFNQLPKLDIDSIDNSMFPLLLHFHPLYLYHYQVNKQADTIMADIMFPLESSKAEIKRDYEFYEPITTHDSSLSKAMFAIDAARIGKDQQSYEFFSQAVKTDLLNLHHNTSDGVHAGSLGAAWEGIFYGFAGIENNRKIFKVNPNLPAQWNSLTFNIFLQGSEYLFTIYENKIEVKLLSGQGNKMELADKTVEFTPDDPVKTIEY